MATSMSLNNKQKWPFLDLSTVDHLPVAIIFLYICVFSFAILGINQGHNLKFEALIDVRPLTILEGGQVPTGGVNGESFGDDLLKNFSFAVGIKKWTNCPLKRISPLILYLFFAINHLLRYFILYTQKLASQGIYDTFL